MRKWAAFITIFSVVGALVFSAGASQAEETPYVIGISLSLTGRAASLGIPEKRIYEMKVEEFNNGGGVNGRKLKLVVIDSESKPANAVLNTKKLIEVDKAVACLGYTTSGATLASVETATAGETLLFSNAASEKIWVPTKKWVFNVVPRQKDACTPFLVEKLLKLGAKKIAYIYIDTAYGQVGKETFDWTCKENGIEAATIEKYAPGTADVSPQITHIKASGADALIICGYVGDTAMVLKSARDLGFKGPIYSEYAVVGPEFIELAGKYGEGVVSTSLKALVAHDLPANDAQKTIAVDLYDKYTKNWGAFSLYSGHAWDSLTMTKIALESVDPKLDAAKDDDLRQIRSKVRDTLEGLKNFVGQNGIFNYSPDNHNGLSYGCYVPVVIQDGKWRLAQD